MEDFLVSDTESFIENNLEFYNRYKKSLNELKLLKM